jgi:leucyl aminopeptidase
MNKYKFTQNLGSKKNTFQLWSVIPCFFDSKSKKITFEREFKSPEVELELKSQEFKAKTGTTARAISTVTSKQQVQKQNYLVLGLDSPKLWEGGKSKSDFDHYQTVRKIATSLHAEIIKSKAKKLFLNLEHFPFDQGQWVAFFECLTLSAYKFDSFKSKKNAVHEIEIICSSKKIDLRFVFLEAKSKSNAISLARDLINTPPNICTPSFLVAKCKQIAKQNQLKIKVYDPVALKRIKAGGILAVAQGSSQKPALVVMKYLPKKINSNIKNKKVALIGKGVTFDSGGLSIKTGAGMMDMKIDMSGAAAVMGVMSVIASIKPNVEVSAYLPLTENMINGEALRPGDVYTSLKGKTVEVLNTDAEGRLILADALAFAEQEGAELMIDIATLTGAALVALGDEYAALFSNSDQLKSKILKASEIAGERLWSMPLAPEYKDQLKSNVADLKNIGGGSAGAITAALFLEEFVSKAEWAHIDMAGPANTSKPKLHKTQGGVGFGVETLIEFLKK